MCDGGRYIDFHVLIPCRPITRLCVASSVSYASFYVFGSVANKNANRAEQVKTCNYAKPTA